MNSHIFMETAEGSQYYSLSKSNHLLDLSKVLDRNQSHCSVAQGLLRHFLSLELQKYMRCSTACAYVGTRKRRTINQVSMKKHEETTLAGRRNNRTITFLCYLAHYS